MVARSCADDLARLYRRHVLAALVNGESDNNCKYHDDADANCDLFPSFHKFPSLRRIYLPPGEACKNDYLETKVASAFTQGDGHTLPVTILVLRKFLPN